MEWRANITDADSFLNFLHRVGQMPHPFNVLVKAGEGEARSLSQNGLFHAWMGQIAKATHDDAASVKADCHIQWGIPLLRSEDDEYAEFIAAALGGRTRAKVKEMIVKGYVPCTSLMKKAQLSRYMDHVWREYAPNVRLMDPAELKWRPAA